jgi:hypothetical protein
MILNTGIQLVMSSTGFAVNLSSDNQLYYGPNYTVPATALSANVVSYNFTGWIPDEGALPSSLSNITAPFVGALTTATFSQTTEVYRADCAWVAILFVTSIVLLFVGVVGVILEHLTTAPDVFDPVAAWTYDNRYLGIPQTGTTLDRLERVRLLKGVVVMVGDVHGDYENGKIGVGRKKITEKLKRGRLYM